MWPAHLCDSVPCKRFHGGVQAAVIGRTTFRSVASCFTPVVGGSTKQMDAFCKRHHGCKCKRDCFFTAGSDVHFAHGNCVAHNRDVHRRARSQVQTATTSSSCAQLRVWFDYTCKILRHGGFIHHASVTRVSLIGPAT